MPVEITGSSGTVSVGEKIQLGVKPKGGGTTIKSVKWTIPGKIVTWYDDKQAYGLVHPFTEPMKSLENIMFYWVDGGDNRTVEADCVIVTAGKEKNEKVSATFNVKRPKLDKFESKTDKVDVFPQPAFAHVLGNPQKLIFGVTLSIVGSGSAQRVVQEPGIIWKWKISVNGAAVGKIKDVQLAKVDIRFVDSAGDNHVLALSGESGPPTIWFLDNENPYGSKAHWGSAAGGPWTLPAGGSTTDNGKITDSPSLGFSTNTEVSFHNQFRYWLMYKSDKADSIWVPIGRLPWFCKGRARKGRAGWRSVAADCSNSVNPAGSESFEFPEWDKRFPNDFSFVKLP